MAQLVSTERVSNMPSGRLRDNVFMVNGERVFMRAYVIPTDPRSEAQQMVRKRFACSMRYGSLMKTWARDMGITPESCNNMPAAVAKLLYPCTSIASYSAPVMIDSMPIGYAAQWLVDTVFSEHQAYICTPSNVDLEPEGWGNWRIYLPKTIVGDVYSDLLEGRLVFTRTALTAKEQCEFYTYDFLVQPDGSSLSNAGEWYAYGELADLPENANMRYGLSAIFMQLKRSDTVQWSDYIPVTWLWDGN